MSFLAQIHVFREYSLHIKAKMFDFVCAEAGGEIPLDLDNKRRKPVSVNFSFDCGNYGSTAGRFLLMSEYFRAVLQILQPLLFD